MRLKIFVYIYYDLQIFLEVLDSKQLSKSPWFVNSILSTKSLFIIFFMEE